MIMQTKDQAKSRVLELCSESEYGSWEFWSKAAEKSDQELQSILEAILELLQEHRIRAFERKFPDRPVDVDSARLRNELQQSLIGSVDPNSFYWFEAAH